MGTVDLVRYYNVISLKAKYLAKRRPHLSVSILIHPANNKSRTNVWWVKDVSINDLREIFSPIHQWIKFYVNFMPIDFSIDFWIWLTNFIRKKNHDCHVSYKKLTYSNLELASGVCNRKEKERDRESHGRGNRWHVDSIPTLSTIQLEL